ncbi:MAG: helix-turn-helix transcriptional regulator [Gemmataceae bacterium]
MKLKKALSQRIKALREASGLSQQEVATRGDLSLSLVAKLEQGKKADPRASTILALAAALGVKPGQLLDDLFPPPAAPAPEPPPAAANGQAEAEEKKAKKQKKAKKKKEQ